MSRSCESASDDGGQCTPAGTSAGASAGAGGAEAGGKGGAAGGLQGGSSDKGGAAAAGTSGSGSSAGGGTAGAAGKSGSGGEGGDGGQPGAGGEGGAGAGGCPQGSGGGGGGCKSGPAGEVSVVSLSASKLWGDVPLSTALSWKIMASNSDGLVCEIDLDDDGVPEETVAPCAAIGSRAVLLSARGVKHVRLTARNGAGASGSASRRVFVNQVDFVPNLVRVRDLPGLVGSEIEPSGMVTLTFASAAQVAQVGPSALLWDEAADGYVARAAAVQKTGAVLHIGTTAASLLDIATGGFHGVQRDESEPSQGPVFDSAPCDPATWGTGWDAGATGLKDISISATGGAYASLGSGTVAGGIRVDSAAFDWSDILAPKVTIEVATRARLCGQFALGVKAPLPSAEKDLPVPTLGAVVDLGLVRAKVGFITTVGVSVAAKLEMGANVYVGADGVAAATWTRGQPLTSTVSFDPTGAVEDFAVESAGEGKIYAKPALQIGWGKPKAPGSLHVALGAEVGVKAKIESTLKNGKLNVCREASLYADALYELAPPFPDIESVEISKTLGETPLWSKPECKEGKAKVVLDKTEVTVAAYEACVAAGACVAAATAELCNWGVAGRGNHPINCVDSYQATAYCAWAGGRLPTGQEWEVAARGEEGRTYPWGEEEPGSRACWRGPGSGYGPNTPDGTCPVGAHPAGATPEGIEDMAGNVSEWTSGCTGSEGCPVGSTAWVCGGSWVHYDSSYLEGSVSFADKPDRIEIDVGFRCVRPE